MEWFYVADQRQVGPLSEAEFARLVGAGTILGETLVWRVGMKEWQPYSALPPIAPPTTPAAGDPGADWPVTQGSPVAAASSAMGTCTQCGRSLPATEMLAYAGGYVCPTCKPMFVQRLKEGARVTAGVRYGGFWIRFAARFVDGIILWIANVMVLLPFGLGAAGTMLRGTPPEAADLPSLLAMQGLLILIQVGIAASYEIFLTTKYGATLGKMILRLKVVRPDGGSIGFGRAVGRYFSTWISGFTLGIGYIIAAFDDEKRSLHDRICDTRVVRA
ncbi:MAG TPA: RDD family protein [Candidatus Polarisedimenticolia bacterium]|nr:RDD family protein [Candidatus Polarisedimenticolia bacterium]